MLTHISITNLALIQNIEIELEPAFSVFTGETGAGKSILLGAIGLLLGNRAASEHIRNAEDRAEVSGIFRFKKLPLETERILEENSISYDNNDIIIRRIISRDSSRNRILINGVVTPLTTLKSLGDTLIDLHGQHDHQALLHENAPYDIIDSLREVKPLRKSFDTAWQTFSQAQIALKNFEKKMQRLQEKEAFLQFQYDEISKLNLCDGEDRTLDDEYRRLSSVNERVQTATEIMQQLEGDAEAPGLATSVAHVLRLVEEISEMDRQFEQWSQDISPFLDIINELASTINRYGESAAEEAHHARLEEINDRIAKIQRLCKKYACSFEELLIKQQAIEAELMSIGESDAEKTALEQQVKQTHISLQDAAETLSTARKIAAEKFDTAVTAEMEKLGFNGGGFCTNLSTHETISETGLEKLLFEVKANAGEPYLPLAKTASGGEISRIMLAIKTVLAENDPVPILVFDEIDTGVGGTRANNIAQAMENLAQHHQIFVISHLHQIAARADHQYAVYKTEENGRTITRIDKLNEAQRLTEIARMLGEESPTTLQHAREILKKGHA